MKNITTKQLLVLLAIILTINLLLSIDNRIKVRELQSLAYTMDELIQIDENLFDKHLEKLHGYNTQ